MRKISKRTKLRRIAMKCIPVMFLAVFGIFTTIAQAAPPQSPEAAQTSVAPLVPAASAQVSVPRLVQFSGTLKDSAARPVLGLASVTFSIYAEQDGGAALWSETQNVTADANGHYTAVLGVASSTGVPQELFGTGQSRWLGVQIARQAELPRVLLVSVPYALKAADAEMLGGQPASAFVTTQALAANNARTTPANTPAPSSSTTIITSGPQVTATSPTGSGTTDFLPLWTSSTTLGNSGLFQKSGMIGLNTTTPAELLDVNGNSIWRGSFQLAPDHPATASSGFTSHSFQFQATSFNSSSKTSITNAFGFLAVPLGNNTSSTSAKLDLFYGPNGGALVDTGLSYSTNGIITFASGQTFPITTANVNELNLPNTTSSTSGVITIAGQPVFNNFGDPSNIFVGQSAGGGFTTTAGENTGVGSNVLFFNTSGGDNTAIGDVALRSNTTGNANTAVGTGALSQNGTGGFNTGVGDSSLGSNTGGQQNVGIGYQSGAGNATGLDDTFLGAFSSANADGLFNATAVGANSKVGISDAVILGGTGSFAVSVGVGTPTPHSIFEITSANGSSITNPGPDLILANTSTTVGSSVGIDFNPTAPANYSIPAARIEGVSVGSSAELQFYAKNSGGTGELLTLTIDSFGNLIVPGSLSVGGILTKSGGTFKIDDPIAPAEKYLSHSFVESPDMKNIYDGTVVLDARGQAVIELPKWFGALNKDYRYQLTAIGRPGPGLYVAKEVQENHFTIAGGRPGLKVSWQVTGTRQDAWANAHRVPTEELKPANEQGHYLHPELFGAGPDKAISAANHTKPKTTPAAAEVAIPSATPAAHPVAVRASAAKSGGATN
jgi:hypothetical protein